MPIMFNRPQFIRIDGLTPVAPVQVLLNDGQNFVVFPTNPRAVDGKPLPIGAHARPFSIVSCNAPPGRPDERVAQLAIDPNAMGDWHPVFDKKRAVILQMLMDDKSTLPLTVDFLCMEHSTLLMAAQFKAAVRRAKFAVHAAVSALFSRRKHRSSGPEKTSDDEIPAAAHTEAR